MTPEQRRLRAKIAANARWSQPMARTDQAAAAREAIHTRLERQVDPDGLLPQAEREVLIRAAARLSAELNAARSRKRAPRDSSATPPADTPRARHPTVLNGGRPQQSEDVWR